ncbi:type I-F CRISPR-associated endoribonuclease Cas6/Csy4 [Acidithiobacillus sp.]
MIPSAYCNLEVRGTATHGHGTMIVPALANLMTVLHGFFVDHPGSYALDFPELKAGKANKTALLGRVIRVFSDSREHCDALLETVEQHAVLSQYIMTGRVRTVVEHSGQWVSMHRARIAPRSQPSNRHRDLEAQQNHQPPFLLMRSHSTQQHFSLMLERRAYLERGADAGVSNSYGLSGARPVYLPDLPA